MTIPVTELEGLDAACAGGDRMVERLRSGVREHLIAVLLPHSVQRLEARRGEGFPGAEETLVQVITAPVRVRLLRPGMSIG
jgi:hypothetical protein